MKLPLHSFFGVVFFTALLCGESNAEPLDAALRGKGLTLFADFFKEHPPHPSLLDHPNVMVFAPTNEAMESCLSQTNRTLSTMQESARMLFRRQTSEENSVNGYGINLGPNIDFSDMEPIGDVTHAGTGTTSEAQVLEPNLNNRTTNPKLSRRHPFDAGAIGRIYSGNGAVSNVLEQLLPYDGGVFYIMDRWVLP